MSTYSSVLAWRIPWREKSGSLQSLGPQESDTTERLTLSFFHRMFFSRLNELIEIKFLAHSKCHRNSLFL